MYLEHKRSTHPEWQFAAKLYLDKFLGYMQLIELYKFPVHIHTYSLSHFLKLDYNKRLGFDKANGDLLCCLEVDLAIDPMEIGQFWDAYVSGRGEYINGTRTIYQMEKKSMPLYNFVGNRFLKNISTPLLGKRFTDTLCGLKAISKRNYKKIRSDMKEFGGFDPFGDFPLIFAAAKGGLKVAEIPVHYRPRQYGASKAYGKSFLTFYKNAWRLVKMS